MMTYKRYKISSVQKKLADLGIEKTPTEIWNQVVGDAGGDQDLAMEMLVTIDEDDASLAYFAGVCAGRQAIIIEREKYIEIPIGHSMIYLAAVVGFGAGLMFGILFFSQGF